MDACSVFGMNKYLIYWDLQGNDSTSIVESENAQTAVVWFRSHWGGTKPTVMSVDLLIEVPEELWS